MVRSLSIADIAVVDDEGAAADVILHAPGCVQRSAIVHPPHVHRILHLHYTTLATFSLALTVHQFAQCNIAIDRKLLRALHSPFLSMKLHSTLPLSPIRQHTVIRHVHLCKLSWQGSSQCARYENGSNVLMFLKLQVAWRQLECFVEQERREPTSVMTSAVVPIGWTATGFR